MLNSYVRIQAAIMQGIWEGEREKRGQVKRTLPTFIFASDKGYLGFDAIIYTESSSLLLLLKNH